MCKVKRLLKLKNLFLVTFLAVAGLFSAAAVITNKQVEETPVVEKADAATLPTYYYIKFKNTWGDNWSCSESNYGIQYYKNSAWTSVYSLTSVTLGSTKCMRWTVVSGTQYIKFFCWNPNSNQNRTVQLSPQDNGDNVFEVTSKSSNSEQTGTWSYHCETTSGRTYDYYLDATNWGIDYASSTPTIQLYYFDDLPGTNGTINATQLKSGYPFYKVRLTGDYKFLWRKGTSWGDHQTSDFNIYQYPVGTKNLCNAASSTAVGTWYKTNGNIQSFTFYKYVNNTETLMSDHGDNGSYYLFNGENFGLSGVALPTSSETGFNLPTSWNEGSFNGTERATSYQYNNVQTNYKLYATYKPNGGSVIGKGLVRVWIGYDSGNPMYKDGRLIKVQIVNSSGTEVAFYGGRTGTWNNTQEGGRRYDYFDISETYYTDSGSTYRMKVQRYTSSDSYEGVTSEVYLKNSEAGKVYFIWSDWLNVVAANIANDNKVDAGMAAVALAGIHTCSTTKCNGYQSFDNIKYTFINKSDGSFNIQGNLSDFEIYDFEKGDTSYSGNRTFSIDAYTKYLWVQYMANNKSGPMPSPASAVSRLTLMTDNDENNTSVILIIVASSISILSITALAVLMVKKKKTANK